MKSMHSLVTACVVTAASLLILDIGTPAIADQKANASHQPAFQYNPVLRRFSDNVPVHLSELNGRPKIALCFFCGCSNCAAAAAYINRHLPGASVYAVVSMSPADLKEFQRRTGWHSNILLDDYSAVANHYTALECPKVVVLDSHGRTVYASKETGEPLKPNTFAALQHELKPL